MPPHRPEEPLRLLTASTSGLQDAHRRSLVRLIFVATAGVLLVFGCVQLFNDNVLFGSGEILTAGVLALSARRLARTHRLTAYIYPYLIGIFAFLVYIILMPRASATAFVWIFMMPVLSYLLLGRFAGLLVALPFMLCGGYVFFEQLAALDNARVLVDFLNPLLCAVMILTFMHVYEIRRAAAEEQLVELAETDALTGLSNRNHFRAILLRTASEAQRSQTRFALALMDIDHFKRINDTHGHDAGDRVLRLIAQRLGERLRSTDTLGRLGGEEFGLILRDVDPPAAFELVEDLRALIERQTLDYDGAELRVTASFGIAYWSDDADNVTELYRVADRRLYDGKHAGRNIVADRDALEKAARPEMGTALSRRKTTG